MPDNITALANTGSGTDVLATDEIAGVHYPRTKIVVGNDGINGGDVSASNPMPVGLSAAQIAELAPLATQPVTGAVSVSNFPASQAVTGPLTDAQLRAAVVPVTGAMTVSGNVSVTGTFFQATQPVSAASLPLPAGAATETSLSALLARTPALGAVQPGASQPVTLPLDSMVGAAASAAALNTDLLTGVVSGWFDAANFHSASIQIVGSAGITAGQIVFEQTNDTVAAAAGNVWPVDESTTLVPTPNVAALAIAASTIRMFGGAITARFVRARVSTAFTGGTVQAIAAFSQLPYARPVQTIHQATAGNLNANVSGTVTANVSGTVTANVNGTGISGGTISPLTVAGTTALASAARTTTGASGALTNNSGRGALFFLNVTAATGTTPTLDVRLQVQDPVSLAFIDLPGCAFAQITTATGLRMIEIAPGLPEAANVRVNRALPRVYQIAWAITGTTPSYTFSVGIAPII